MNKFIKIFLLGFLVLAVFAFVTSRVSANEHTGDSDAYQCNSNTINTEGYRTWHHDKCISGTPTISPTVTPTCTPTPSEVSPTPTEITPTPVDDPCANNACPGTVDTHGDGRSDGRSDGKSSAPAPIQAVLGLSNTSSVNNMYAEIAQGLTALVLAAAGFKFFKRNA